MCKEGFGLVDKACRPCVAGKTFSAKFDALPCQAVDTCEPPADWTKSGEYELTPPTRFADRTCATHADTCTDTEWEVHPPTATSDRQCAGAGVCANGALIALKQRKQANHCASCGPGSYRQSRSCIGFAGSCANGLLAPQASRAQENHCGTFPAAITSRAQAVRATLAPALMARSLSSQHSRRTITVAHATRAIVLLAQRVWHGRARAATVCSLR